MLKIFLLAHALWFTLAQSAAWMPFARWFKSLPLTWQGAEEFIPSFRRKPEST